MAVALLSDPACQLHDTGDHVENGHRLAAIWQEIERSGLRSRLLAPPPSPASLAQAARIHTPAYIERLQRLAQAGGGALDADTIVAPGSFEAALAAAGCACGGVDAVMAGQAQVAFALVRPPGHHARPGNGMGFCLLNNAAIAAQHALDRYGLARVLIADFDAHHGNGTQEAFYGSSRVLYFSSHLSPFYPGTGHAFETGNGDGAGYTVNVPLPYDTGDDGMYAVYEQALAPVAERFRPQLMLVSAGYDVHWADPLTPLGLTVCGITRLVALLTRLAGSLCPGKLVVVLEGGYHLAALADGVSATLRQLLGDPAVDDRLGPFAGDEADVGPIIAEVRRIHRL